MSVEGRVEDRNKEQEPADLTSFVLGCPWFARPRYGEEPLKTLIVSPASNYLPAQLHGFSATVGSFSCFLSLFFFFSFLAFFFFIPLVRCGWISEPTPH